MVYRSKKHLQTGESKLGRSHPKAQGILALMLEDAAETCSSVPSLTSQNCISLGSIAGHQRKKAPGIPPNRKQPPRIAKDCLAGMYLMPEDEERYKM